jgi:hypothetical protein
MPKENEGGKHDDDSADSLYKRMEDQKWRESTSSRIVSLTDSEVTQNDRLDEIDDEISAVKEMLEGKTSDKDDNGIKGDIHDLSVGVNELRRLMMPDHLGQGGVIARLRILERAAGIEEKAVESRWKFFTAIAVAIISTAGFVLSNLDKIEKYLNRNQKKDPLATMIEKGKRPRSGRRISIRYVPPPADEPDSEVDGSADEKRDR